MPNLPNEQVPVGSTLSVENEKFRSIYVEHLDLTPKTTNDLQIDSAVQNKNIEHLKGRLLEKMTDSSAWLAPETKATLDKNNNKNIEWNQFEANTRLFNVKNTYDENIYTKKLDRSLISQEKQDEAARIAYEIENSSTTNIHLQEERGHLPEREIDEEARYSGVIREAAVIDKKEKPIAVSSWKRGEKPVTNSAPPGLNKNQIPKSYSSVTATKKTVETTTIPPPPQLTIEKDVKSITTPAVDVVVPEVKNEKIQEPVIANTIKSPEPIIQVDAKVDTELKTIPTTEPTTESEPVVKKPLTLNPNAKEFSFNPAVKEFVPPSFVQPQQLPQPQMLPQPLFDPYGNPLDPNMAMNMNMEGMPQNGMVPFGFQVPPQFLPQQGDFMMPYPNQNFMMPQPGMINMSQPGMMPGMYPQQPPYGFIPPMMNMNGLQNNNFMPPNMQPPQLPYNNSNNNGSNNGNRPSNGGREGR